jgi:adenylate cyclase
MAISGVADHGATLVRSLDKSISRFLDLTLRKPKLSVIMAALFVCLSIPVLIFILVFNYHKTSQTIIATLHEDVARTRLESIDNVEDMIQAVSGTLRLLAATAAAAPGYFRTEPSREVLFHALTSAPEIDAAFVSFEDGYHRVVTRIDDDRRRSDPRIPSSANWHSSYIDDFSAGDNRKRHRTFFDTWGHVVATYDVSWSIDYRFTSGYPAAKQSRAVVVTDPELNPDTGYPILNMRAPILHDGEFIGCAGTTITLNVLTEFLATHRASPHSTTVIANASDDKIIATSERTIGVRMIDGHLQIARLANVADEDLREAYRLHTQTRQDEFLFRSPRDGQEMSASFTHFPESFGHPWETIVLTPTDDFIGQLKEANRQLVIIIAALSALELILIYFLARRLSHPIESISRALKSIEDLSFDQAAHRPSNVREIAQLQSAASLLRTSLQSFSSFAPVELVKSLIKSGIPLTLGVEKRFLTVFFSDVENFSTHAEQMPPDDLLSQISVYFEQVSRAIADEQGTVDKFIGDGVMAFWGAPLPLADGALHACRGALRAVRRMERTNQSWLVEGRPAFRVRIGLNSADVLVGNVGSSDRFSYTVMGDGVNVAARLEGMNKTFGTTICISDSVFDAVAAKIVARPLRRVQVKGRKQAFMVYGLLGIADTDDPELEVSAEDNKLSAMTWIASAYYEKGDFAAAALRYAEILKAYPNDAVAKAMLSAIASSPLHVEA